MIRNTLSLSKQYEKMIFEKEDEIKHAYILNPNVVDLIAQFNIARAPLTRFLKKHGLYKGLSSSANSRAEKRLKTLQARYGIDNYGQTENMKQQLRLRNAIPIITPNFINNFKQYKQQVTAITIRNKKLLMHSSFCYYTGIQFAVEPANPNDLLKRTLDHKISCYQGYLLNIDANVIGGLSNIVWCIRYCNSIKGNMTTEQFLPFAKIIREQLINENYQHN